ncbi:MAG: hypothetical protein ER33_07175 [Cyanobium sp. CACIAM 14]|nr:MAG: hypothetical protein ER33_07175 [Cyanobium sp. CACIAM 14]
MPSPLRALLIGLAASLALAAPSLAQASPVLAQKPDAMEHREPHDHGAHGGGGAAVTAGHTHDLGPAGATYDLRFIDGMVQHHTGALRMSEFVFGIGQPGVGALARRIWRDQADEIRAMGLWRKAWYPQAPVYPVVLAPGGDPDSLSGLRRMSPAQIAGMRMTGEAPTPSNRVVWFLEGMLHHHGGALIMAHDALAKSTNPTIRRFARQVIVAQRAEIIELRRMLALEGLHKPEYSRYDSLFAL